jgi:hypothetical protein
MLLYSKQYSICIKNLLILLLVIIIICIGIIVLFLLAAILVSCYVNTLPHVTPIRVYSRASAPFFLHESYYTHTTAFYCNTISIFRFKLVSLICYISEAFIARNTLHSGLFIKYLY